MLGINLNRSKFDVPQPTTVTKPTQPQFKLNTLNKDTVSFSGVAHMPLTNADVYLENLGKLVKSVNNSTREDAEGYIQMVALEDIPRVKAEHKRLLDDPNVKPVIKQLIRFMEPKLASDARGIAY